MGFTHGVVPFFGNGGELLSGWIGFPASCCGAGRRRGDGWCFVVHGFGLSVLWMCGSGWMELNHCPLAKRVAFRCGKPAFLNRALALEMS